MKYPSAIHVALGLSLWLATAQPGAAHNGITVGHSPFHPDGTAPCPTQEPLRLFLLPDPVIGGPIAPESAMPAMPGQPSILTRVSINALLARPEFGGFVYAGDAPGVHVIDAATPCHALTTEFTGGQPFTLSLDRVYWPSASQIGVADSFGNQLLLEDGLSHVVGDQDVVHFHPLWLARRAGEYAAAFRMSSDMFLPSAEFSLVYRTTPTCAVAVPVDLAGVFNADVVDSDELDSPTPFDGNGHFWALSAPGPAASGLPQDGRLDVFQLGGADGSNLAGSSLNCIFDDGTLSSAATINLVAQAADARYESIEMLIAAAGGFSSADRLLVTLSYAGGTNQTVTIRQAAAQPRYFPLADWQQSSATIPLLSVGRAGNRAGGGFVRSDGDGIDAAAGASTYFQRVTFPADASRTLTAIALADYTGAGRVGVFAITAMRGVPACPGQGCAVADIQPECGDCDVDLSDLSTLLANFGRLGNVRRADGDLDGDRAIDIADLATMLASFGTNCN